ncbi:MAG: hypothetical protein HZA04_08800 [Nitrospinae bacterium]|nr:hypothetical protein [Nitrospinota bacterium]
MDIRRHLKGQKGFALLAVIFILVAMAGLGVTVSKLVQNQARQASSAVGVQDSYYASQSGLEWAVQQATDNGYTAPYSQIAGAHTLPNGDTFTIAYDALTDKLSSTANKGNDQRMLVLAAFSTIPSGGGGGTDPNESCSVAADGNVTGTDLFATRVASADEIDGSIPGSAENIHPKTFSSMPSFPAGVSYPNRTYSGGTTSLTSSTPTVNNPELYYNDLKLEDHGTMNVTGPTGVGNYLTVYVKGDFKVRDSSTLNVTGNVRFVVGTSRRDDENVIMQGATVNIATGGNLLLVASGRFKAENNFAVNSGAGSSASNLLIMTMGDIKFENNGTIKGGLYSLDDIKIDNSPTITGAMVAVDKIDKEHASSVINYDNTAGQSVVNNIKTC